MLSGDIQRDSESSNNVWHVITVNDDVAQLGVRVILGDLTIESGNANGPWDTGLYLFDHENGGGIYSLLTPGAVSQPYLGMYSVEVRDNTSFAGGGLLMFSGDLEVNHSEFIRNSAVVGGALYIFSSTVNIDKSSFEHNSAIWGGAVRIVDNTSGTISNSTFKANSSIVGGSYCQKWCLAVSFKRRPDRHLLPRFHL